MVLLKGMEWRKSDEALKKLKEMMWGLEALRVFDDKLARALVHIRMAKRKLRTTLKTVLLSLILEASNMGSSLLCFPLFSDANASETPPGRRNT